MSAGIFRNRLIEASFHSEVDIEQRVFGQPQTTTDLSCKDPIPTHTPEDSLNAQLAPQDRVCLSIMLHAMSIGRKKGSVLPPVGEGGA